MCNRICKQCSIDFPLNNKHFIFYNTTGYFSRTCRICHNLNRTNVYKTGTTEYRQKIILDKTKYNKTFIGRVNKIISSYTRLDKNKGLVCNLSKLFVANCLNSSCVYCGYPVVGLDRINNKIGHIESNCVPCCKECNVARMDNFSFEEMIIIGQSIKKIKDNRL